MRSLCQIHVYQNFGVETIPSQKRYLCHKEKVNNCFFYRFSKKLGEESRDMDVVNAVE